jgi:UMF1 family MFS transporter
VSTQAGSATHDGTAMATPAAWRIGRLSVASWVLYDLANTAFSLGIITYFFPRLVKDVLDEGDATVMNLDALAAALIFVAAPVLGALSDQASRRLPFLVVSTLACVAATFFLGQSDQTLMFGLFVIASVCFQAGLIFYDSLLPEVSTDENRGRIGGLGVGVGYGGSLIAFAVGSLILLGIREPTLGDYADVFRALAVVFLLFAVPAFLFVRERPRAAPALSWRIVPEAFRQLAATARRARRYRGLGPFLLGRLFYADAANTLIFAVVLYAERSLRMNQAESMVVVVLSILAAVPAGIIWGRVVDRLGPRRTLDIVLVLWMAVFSAAAAIPVLGLPSQLIYVTGVAIGIGIAGLWSADRPLMARLAPPRYYGQFFGLYAMCGRFAAVIGPFMWGVIADPANLGWGQPAAVMFLLLWVVIAFAILRRVDDRPREWGPDDMPDLAMDATAAPTA